MSLYICNATPRAHHLNYRLPGDERVYDRIIAAGTQFKTLHTEPDQEAAIIKQIEAFGAVSPAKVGNNKAFSGIIYSSKPIPLDDIRAGLSDVDTNAINRALEHRTAAAVGADEALAKGAQEAGASASSFEVSIKEQPRAGVANEDLQQNTVQVEREGKASRKRRNN